MAPKMVVEAADLPLHGRNLLAGQPLYATLMPKMDSMYVSCIPTG